MFKYFLDKFKHQVGEHCESTSMRDVLEYIGLKFSEAMIYGLDATFGFSFFKSQNGSGLPFFVGGKQGTITKDSLACRLLGVNIIEEQFQSAEQCWERSKQLLIDGKPLLIRIEMAYLPYVDLPQGEYFGGHIMSLVGFDEKNAYLYERDIQDPVKLSIDILKKARNSKEDKWFPPRNTHYILDKRPKRPPFSAACKLALQQTAKNMLAASTNFIGLQGMKNFVNSISNWTEMLQGTLSREGKIFSKAQITLELLYGYMEEFGTGGAVFRNLFGDFLDEIITHPDIVNGPHTWKLDEINLVRDQLPLIRQSAENWTEFAKELKHSVDQGEEKCLDYINFEKLENLGRENIQLEETVFRNLIKLRI